MNSRESLKLVSNHIHMVSFSYTSLSDTLISDYKEYVVYICTNTMYVYRRQCVFMKNYFLCEVRGNIVIVVEKLEQVLVQIPHCK